MIPNVTARIFRFSVSGITATLLHVFVATATVSMLKFSPPVANGFAFLVATTLSYVLNTTWSFSAQLRGRTLLRFLIVSAVGCSVAMMVSAVAEQQGLYYLWGIALVAMTVPVLTFLLHNFWTYRAD